jgi:hypothetical protein
MFQECRDVSFDSVRLTGIRLVGDLDQSFEFGLVRDVEVADGRLVLNLVVEEIGTCEGTIDAKVSFSERRD